MYHTQFANDCCHCLRVCVCLSACVQCSLTLQKNWTELWRTCSLPPFEAVAFWGKWRSVAVARCCTRDGFIHGVVVSVTDKIFFSTFGGLSHVCVQPVSVTHTHTLFCHFHTFPVTYTHVSASAHFSASRSKGKPSKRARFLGFPNRALGPGSTVL